MTQVIEMDTESKKISRLPIPIQSKTCQKDLQNQRKGNRPNFVKKMKYLISPKNLMNY